MEAVETPLKDVLLIEPKVFGDDRGFFFESFNQKSWREATGLDTVFVQDNHSRSVKGVLRGLHFQNAPHAQAKLVRAVVGEIFDVAVDLREGSPTFGKWWGATLSAENKRQLWIPEGFAHAFLTLSDVAEVLYKATDYYAPECEGAIIWNDPDIGIEWPDFAGPLSLSAKDEKAKSFKHAMLADG
jgi:dTDP-4-dehydrorhamnose 3,5-epimerase